MRFIFTADICGAWASFGGIAAQLNSVSIILHLATTESIAAALLYDSILSAHLEELARARVERSADTVDFAALLSAEQPRFKLHAIAQAVKPTPVNDAQKDKKLKKEQDTDAPSNKPAGWLPKKEYLAKLAAEKAANERIALAAEKAEKGKKRPYSRRRSRSRSQKKKSARRERSPVRETMKRQRRRN